MLSIAACLAALLAASPADAGENCRACHRDVISGPHAGIGCSPCHGSDTATVRRPDTSADRAARCVTCHRGFDRMFDHAMATRDREKKFASRTVGRHDGAFFDNQCGGCHVTGCLDCHPGGGHAIRKPADGECLSCHRGYFVGADYHGRAPREDALRFQRGEVAGGDSYLQMTPDVHAEKGISCGACHDMKSLAAGKKSGKTCTDCHSIDRSVPEHRIAAHITRMECFACHSAWTPQEYGTFYLRFSDSSQLRDFPLATRQDDYVKSGYLKKQDAPPLGLNAAGKISPIRPQFILYFSDIRNHGPVGQENRLLAAEWKALFPHTVRRGSVLCDGCHDAPARFLLEPERTRIYQVREEGLTLRSFWDRDGQRVVNGSFLQPERVRKLAERTPEYAREYVRKWQTVTGQDGRSSRR